METAIMGYIGIIGTISGLYGDNGKENGNYYLGFRVQGMLQMNPSPKTHPRKSPSNPDQRTILRA